MNRHKHHSGHTKRQWIPGVSLKLPEKQAELTLATARLAVRLNPLDVLCWWRSVRETLNFHIKLVWVVITWSVCFGEKENSADNAAHSKNLVKDEA